MSGTILRRRDRAARPPRVEHYSSAVNTGYGLKAPFDRGTITPMRALRWLANIGPGAPGRAGTSVPMPSSASKSHGANCQTEAPNTASSSVRRDGGSAAIVRDRGRGAGIPRAAPPPPFADGPRGTMEFPRSPEQSPLGPTLPASPAAHSRKPHRPQCGGSALEPGLHLATDGLWVRGFGASYGDTGH